MTAFEILIEICKFLVLIFSVLSAWLSIIYDCLIMHSQFLFFRFSGFSYVLYLYLPWAVFWPLGNIWNCIVLSAWESGNNFVIFKNLCSKIDEETSGSEIRMDLFDTEAELSDSDSDIENILNTRSRQKRMRVLESIGKKMIRVMKLQLMEKFGKKWNKGLDQEDLRFILFPKKNQGQKYMRNAIINISKCHQLHGKHGASVKWLKHTRFAGNAFISLHDLFCEPISFFTVRLQVVLGLPRFRLPYGFQFRACLHISWVCFLKVSPIHPQ